MTLEKAFCAAYGVDTPKVELSRIAHWKALLGGAAEAVAPVHRETAYVAPGHFFQVASPVPSFHEQLYHLAEAEGADWLLYPSMPVLGGKELGIPGHACLRVPFFPAAYLDTGGDLDGTLRRNLGRHRLKEILRLTRKAEAACVTRIERLSALNDDDPMLEAFVGLHAMNATKYEHSVNLFSRPVLSVLARTDAAQDYYLKVNFCKETMVPLHASLSHADPSCGVFTQLVQGQDRRRAGAGLNLYVTDYYHLYAFAEGLGYRCHGLGRGAVEMKIRLGANRIQDLENWLVPLESANMAEMRALVASLTNGR